MYSLKMHFCTFFWGVNMYYYAKFQVSSSKNWVDLPPPKTSNQVEILEENTKFRVLKMPFNQGTNCALIYFLKFQRAPYLTIMYNSLIFMLNLYVILKQYFILWVTFQISIELSKLSQNIKHFTACCHSLSPKTRSIFALVFPTR